MGCGGSIANIKRNRRTVPVLVTVLPASPLTTRTAHVSNCSNSNNVMASTRLDEPESQLKDNTGIGTQENGASVSKLEKKSPTPSQLPRKWSSSSKMNMPDETGSRNTVSISVASQSYSDNLQASKHLDHPERQLKGNAGIGTQDNLSSNVKANRIVPTSSKSPRNWSSTTRINIPDEKESRNTDSMSVAAPSKIGTLTFEVSSDILAKESNHLELIKTIDLTSDELPRNITSIAFLEDIGAIVLCDQINKKLLLCTNSFEQVHELASFCSNPHNVAYTPDLGVAVTFPETKTIHFRKVTNRQFGDYVNPIKTKYECMGVCYVDGSLIYTNGSDVEVVEKHSENAPKRPRCLTTKRSFNTPKSIHLDNAKNMFISCYGGKGLKAQGEIVKMSKEGDIHFATKFEEIPRPVSIVCDSQGYIYVCNENPRSIHQLDPQGKYCRKLLGPNDGQFQHINVLPNGDFLITEANNDKLSIYRFRL